MIPSPATRPLRPIFNRVTAAALAVVVVLAGIFAMDLAPHRWLREELFDLYQRLIPRERKSAPVVIVAIDEASLAGFGQWPWPRTLTARLIDRIAEARPAAIGLDIVMPEPDRLSPQRYAEVIRWKDPEIASRIAALPGNDSVLAGSIAGRPVVLGIAGLGEGNVLDNAAAGSLRPPPFLLNGPDPSEKLRSFVGALASVPELGSAAAGQGLLNSAGEYKVVRSAVMVARVGQVLVPTLGLEMLRVASGAPALRLDTDAAGIRAVRVGDLSFSTQPDGLYRIRYSRHDPRRFVSAAALLDGRIDPERLERKLVLLGVTASGLIDQQSAPTGERVSGIEIHAQLLENLFDGDGLTRAPGAAWIEFLLLLAGGTLIAVAVPRLRPVAGWLVPAGVVASFAALGLAAFALPGVLIDAATPALACLIAFASSTALSLADTQRQRSRLARELQAEREAAAHLAGELEAARRVQMGLLPSSQNVLGGDPRAEIEAWMAPARQVGGDLYDFFRMDDGRLFFAVGDVSGKGLPASMFMVVSKALTKSAALRRGARIATVVSEANREIARENPEAMFVTLLACALDLGTGRLEYCCAGHEPPIAMGGTHERPSRLPAEGGPPMCFLETFDYIGAEHAMRPGETLCLFTDGLTEAQDRAGNLYGRERLSAVLARANPAAPLHDISAAIRADIGAFVGAAEAADDLTIVLVRWNGAVNR